MPFSSEAQRKYLWAKHPEIARKWSAEYGKKALPGVGGPTMEVEAERWKYARRKKRRERLEKEWAKDPSSRTHNPKYPTLS